MTPRTARPSRPRSLVCPHCGAPVTIRASGLSVTAACAACGSVLDVNDAAVRLIGTAQQRTRTPLIAIGARGTLAGTVWEVVGYQERSSEQGSWRWEEYLLFNPYRGFRFLGQDHGHWTLYGLLRQAVGAGGVIDGDPHRYRREFGGPARTEYVLGEFYWRVRTGDTVEVTDYVDAPCILSEERGGDEVTWSRGVYVEPEVVRAGFKLAQMPPRVGRAAHQPTRASARPARRWLVAVACAGALVALQAASFGQDRDRVVFQQSFVAAARNPAVSSAAFDVPGAGGNLSIGVAPANRDDWLQFDVALIDAAGNRTEDQTFTMPPRFGDDGNGDPSVTFASVRGGRYRLLVTGSASATGDAPGSAPGSATPSAAAVPVAGPDVAVTVTVRRHPPAWINFWAALAVVLAWPGAASLAGWFGRVRHGPES